MVGQQLHRALEVREEDGHLLAFALECAPRGEDPLGEGLRRIGIGGGGTGKGQRRRGGRPTTTSAKLHPRFGAKAARQAREGQRGSALGAEAATRAVVGSTPGTRHGGPPSGARLQLRSAPKISAVTAQGQSAGAGCFMVRETAHAASRF